MSATLMTTSEMQLPRRGYISLTPCQQPRRGAPHGGESATLMTTSEMQLPRRG